MFKYYLEFYEKVLDWLNSIVFIIKCKCLKYRRLRKISDLKAFSSYISVYLKDSQTHTCAESSNTRFQSDVTQPHITSFLLTAFTAGKGVCFQYDCDGITAIITGVRLQESS